jgi:hypothetical protein
MKNIKAIVFFVLFFISVVTAYGQSHKENNLDKNWFAISDIGIQMSGIKSEDFINSNYSPMVRIIGGKLLNSSIGFQVGYQGRYFNAIADTDKHYYNFYFVEGVLDVKSILFSIKRDERFHTLLLHAGVGSFQNHYYGNSSVHGVLGTSNIFSILKKIKIKFDIGAIVGWDIYQGDEDILPSLSMGVVYLFDYIPRN